MARGILYTSKSRVGETPIAAATACLSPELGCRMVAINADTAHSLADSFDISLVNGPQPCASNLWRQETSTSRTPNAYWDTIQKTSNKDEEV